MTTKSDRYFNNTTKVMRFGYDLFSPVIPPPTEFIHTSSTYDLSKDVVNPQDITIPKNACFKQNNWQKQVQQVKSDTMNFAFTIGSHGYLETVRSPYSNLGDAFLTSYDMHNNDCNPISLYKDVSFHEVLPSSAISQSEIIFDENPLGFVISTTNSFSEEHINSSGITDTSAVANSCETISLSTKQNSNDPSFLRKYNTIFEDEIESEMVTSHDEESEFSVESKQVIITSKESVNAKDEIRQKKTRKNYNSNTTNVLMDWFFQHDGKAPNNQIKKELAMETGKSVIQSECFFFTAKSLNFVLMFKQFQHGFKTPGVVTCNHLKGTNVFLINIQI